MRVLMTADPIGGVWTYTVELARALRARDVDVVVASMGGRPTGEQRRAALAAGIDRLYATDYALEWMQDPWRDVAAAGDWLLDVAGRVDPDLVHLNGYVHARLDWGVPTVVVAHSCVLSWFEAVRRAPAPPEFARYAREVEDGLQAADLVVAPTRAMLAALRRHYRFDTERIVVENGRPPLAPAEKRPFVLGAGRAWDDAKNVSMLERVADRVRWDVRVVGAGSAAGVVGRAELEALFAHASIFCHPARYEPFGLAALEAASAGCALVLGDIDTLHEVWEDAAVYVDPDDDDALVAALARLIENECARAELAGRARVRARRFTPERMADGYLDAYDRVTAAELEEAAA